MHWKTLALATFTAAALAFSGATANAGGGDAGGSLGAGGVAKGDISMTAGETDRITVDLVAGAPLNLTFTATFAAAVSLSDPDAQPVDLGTTGGRSVKLRGFAVAKTGTYTFTVASSDGSQGVYSLSVNQKWSKAVPVSGAGEVVLDVAMPASGKILGVFSRERGAAAAPRILSLQDPSAAELLPAAIEPKGNVAKLPPTVALTAGGYRLTVTATDGASAWKGTVKRIVPRTKPTRITLTNGLDAISFAGDGVDQVFKRSCGSCHSWATNYGGVRAYASIAYGKIKAGSMPPGGRLPAQQTALIQAWMQTGKSR